MQFVEESKKLKDIDEIKKQNVIHRLEVKIKNHEILEKSLKEQLELSDEREKTLAKRVVELDEKIISLKKSLDEAELKEIELKNEYNYCNNKLEKSFIQVTQVFDDVNDKTITIASQKANNEKLLMNINELEYKNEILKTEKTTLKKQLDDSKIENKKMENISKENKSVIDKQQNDLLRQNSIIAELNKEVDQLSSRINLLETDKKSIKEANELTSSKLSKVKQELNDAQFELNENTIKYEHITQKNAISLEESKKTTFNLRKDLLNVEKQLESSKHDVKELKRELNSLNAVNESLNIKATQAEHKTNLCNKTIAKMNLENQKQEFDILTLNGKIKAFENEKERLGTELEIFDEKCNKLKYELETTKSSNSKIMTERSELCELNKKFSLELEKMKDTMQKTEKEWDEKYTKLVQEINSEKSKSLRLETEVSSVFCCCTYEK